MQILKEESKIDEEILEGGLVVYSTEGGGAGDQGSNRWSSFSQ